MCRNSVVTDENLYNFPMKFALISIACIPRLLFSNTGVNSAYEKLNTSKGK